MRKALADKARAALEPKPVMAPLKDWQLNEELQAARAEIERHMREKVELAGLVMKERDDNERLRAALGDRYKLRDICPTCLGRLEPKP